MTNNFREEYDAFVEDTRMYGNYDEVLSEHVWKFISNLITKKDQEHKAELEMINRKVKKIKTHNVEAPFDDYISTVSKEEIISIIDSHINKLSTE